MLRSTSRCWCDKTEHTLSTVVADVRQIQKMRLGQSHFLFWLNVLTSFGEGVFSFIFWGGLLVWALVDEHRRGAVVYCEPGVCLYLGSLDCYCRGPPVLVNHEVGVINLG